MLIVQTKMGCCGVEVDEERKESSDVGRDQELKEVPRLPTSGRAMSHAALGWPQLNINNSLPLQLPTPTLRS